MSNLSLASAKACLPAVICDMADIIGFTAVEKLVDGLGGSTFLFGKGRRDTERLDLLCRVIGESNAYKLLFHYGGENIYIPRCLDALRCLRDVRFKNDYLILTQVEGKSGRMAMTELCPKYQISDRTGWKILGRKDGPVIQQQNLF